VLVLLVLVLMMAAAIKLQNRNFSSRLGIYYFLKAIKV
jgi:hypothetical protein